ncbi:hypothetical protein MHB40_14775 [Lysinibacillus sp. FSL K6-0057]|uniref:hypothetical protein n=1 Tax=Lysinibacillus sp. FSL K6-0057 TaxID=2921411 RepID=UPI003159F01C
MKKCGRIYYEISEKEHEEINDLIMELYDYHRNLSLLDMDDTFNRLFKIINVDER